MKFLFLKKYFLFAFCCCCFLTNTFAQQTEIDANTLAQYNHAQKLYLNKAYAAAQKSFAEVAKTAPHSTNLKADASFFDAMCDIKLNKVGADKKVLKFVEENPNSNKKNKAYLHVGNYYFANKKAAYALKWYTKVDEEILALENRKELNFKMGYALLATDNLMPARKRFLPLLNDSKYGNDARYYYGYIAYKQEDYDIAEATLEEIAEKGSRAIEVTYFLLDISFKSGRFERCIEVGKKLLPKAKRQQKSDISKIIGESYFNLEQYKEAIPYLKAYKGKRGKWNNTDYYQLGYIYYQQKDYENAIKYFNKIIDQENNVSQNAYYNLGECYLNLKRKSEALNAFKSASEMDFNAKVKEDAMLNYAKLSYEEGNPYKSVAQILQDYLKAYPKSSHYNEINALIVTSFLHQQDYQGALDYLAKKKSKENNAFTYEVSLYRGMQLFNEKNYTKALPYFIEGKNSYEIEIELKSSYWKAETDYLLGNYTKAVDEFLAFKKRKDPMLKNMEEFYAIDYHIGYTYFKLKDYKNGALYFDEYIQLNREESGLKGDAIIRLGDCFFAEKEYQKAINSYQKIIDEGESSADYAQYQMAMSYGFLGDNSKKTTSLKEVINVYEKSSLKDDALFQLGNTYADLKENTEAHKAYKRLINKYPKSGYVPRALLRDGLLFYNDNEYQKSIATYKQIAKKYPNTREAKEAVANAKNVYVDMENVDGYTDWVQSLSFISLTDDEVDNTLYEAAQNKFLEDNTKKAITGFTKYLKRFPEGIHHLKAHFYLAKLYLKTADEENATIHYEYVVNEELSEYSEEALTKLAEIYLEKEDWKKAMPLLVRLEQEANFAQNILFAQSNLMKGYYEKEDYKKAVTYAETVLTKNKIGETIEADAKLIIARAALKTGDLQTAEEFYMTVEREATGEVKAEALYYNAFFQHKNKEYDVSNKTIQNLTANYSAYKYWGAKALVLMANNYHNLKETYQATYILESVIKNFTSYEDVIAEAKTKLTKIKKEEAKTNNSVTPQNK